MTDTEKRLTLEVWMQARTAFRIRLRKIISIALTSGLPVDEIERSASEIITELEVPEVGSTHYKDRVAEIIHQNPQKNLTRPLTSSS